MAHTLEAASSDNASQTVTIFQGYIRGVKLHFTYIKLTFFLSKTDSSEI